MPTSPVVQAIIRVLKSPQEYDDDPAGLAADIMTMASDPSKCFDVLLETNATPSYSMLLQIGRVTQFCRALKDAHRPLAAERLVVAAQQRSRTVRLSAAAIALAVFSEYPGIRDLAPKFVADFEGDEFELNADKVLGTVSAVDAEITHQLSEPVLRLLEHENSTCTAAAVGWLRERYADLFPDQQTYLMHRLVASGGYVIGGEFGIADHHHTYARISAVLAKMPTSALLQLIAETLDKGVDPTKFGRTGERRILSRVTPQFGDSEWERFAYFLRKLFAKLNAESLGRYLAAVARVSQVTVEAQAAMWKSAPTDAVAVALREAFVEKI